MNDWEVNNEAAKFYISNIMSVVNLNLEESSDASTAYLYIIVYNREINSLPIKQNIISSN